MPSNLGIFSLTFAERFIPPHLLMTRFNIALNIVAILCAVSALMGCTGVSQKSTNQNDGIDTDTVANRCDTLTIVFAGDAMMDVRQLNCARQNDGTYDFSTYFTHIMPYIKSADYAVVNLETTLADKDFTGFPQFSSPKNFANTLLDAGFDLLLTANNHCLDKFDAGLRRTLDALDSIGATHCGTYRNEAERDSLTPLFVDIKGVKTAFINYTYATNGIRARDGAVVNYIDRKAIKAEIDKARAKGADLIIANIHWGIEYELLPHKSQTDLAQFLVDEGVDIVNGGHPHVVQPMKMVQSDSHHKKALVIYSLGNFVSIMRKTTTQGGAMVKATLVRDKNGKMRVEAAEYLPTFCERGTPGVSNFRVLVADSVTSPENRAQAHAYLDTIYPFFEKNNKDVPRSRTF